MLLFAETSPVVFSPISFTFFLPMKDIAVASPELAVAGPISNAILIFLPGLQLFFVM